MPLLFVSANEGYCGFRSGTGKEPRVIYIFRKLCVECLFNTLELKGIIMIGKSNRYGVRFLGKEYVIFSEYQYLKEIFNKDAPGDQDYGTLILPILHIGAEIYEKTKTSEEKFIGVMNMACFKYATEKTINMECSNASQYEEVSTKKVEAVLEFMRSNAYLFTLGT